MAIFIKGMACPLCRRALDEQDEVVMFPPFVANRRDPMFLFSDAVCHQRCFVKHPLAEQVSRTVEKLQEAGAPGNRICASCGSEIRDPDDYFTAGYLTNDPGDPLFKYNFLQLHRSHFEEWPEFERFRDLVKQLQSSSRWEGPGLAFERPGRPSVP